MAGYLTNTLIKFTRRDVDGYNVADYTSIDLVKVREYINLLPDTMFDWLQIQDDDKWERIALEQYGNADYWDVLVVLNNRNPLTGLPFTFDVISDLSEDRVLEFEKFVYNKATPDVEHGLMYTAYETARTLENDANRVLKIVRPSQLNKFLQDAHDQGIF